MNVIGHRAIVGVPEHRGGNVTLCAAGGCPPSCQPGALEHSPALFFLNHMQDALLGQQDEHPIYVVVVVWDNEVLQSPPG